jgi:Lon protease-like protein
MMPESHSTPFVLPDRLPVMVLSGCVLLPASMQPLFIFEERYRRMLDHALHTDRLFCIGDATRAGRIRPILTAGLIANSRRAEDGTSQVLLQGIGRVRITGWEQEEPFLIARVEPFSTASGPEETLKTLVAEVVRSLSEFKTSDPLLAQSIRLFSQTLQLETLKPDLLCDLVSSLLLTKVSARRAILAEPVLERRLERLLLELDRL